jgi:hypothetical protein
MQVASVINRNFFISTTNAGELSVSSCSQITQQSLKMPGTLVRLQRNDLSRQEGSARPS